MEFGYIRVSSVGQNTDRQLADLSIPPENFFTDRLSGKDTERPELRNLLRTLREGDILHVHSLDRLSRNLRDLLKILDELIQKGVEIRFHKENLVFAHGRENSAMNRLILQIFGALAEWERSIIHQRQAEGIAQAKLQGKHLGRPSSVTKEQKEEVKRRLRQDMLMNLSRLSRETGVPRSTIRLIRSKMQEEQEPDQSES
ncbi:MAG: recombinase family protein [Lachnospiraceae bacterium]|nr:recombinase family protein [Lachnospiraceae bacterium]